MASCNISSRRHHRHHWYHNHNHHHWRRRRKHYHDDTTTTSLFVALHVALLVILCCVLTMMMQNDATITLFVSADWIDPDTPKDAYTTTSLEVHVPPKTTTTTTTDDGSDDDNSSSSSSQSPTMIPSSTPTSFSPNKNNNNKKLFHLVMSDEFNIDGRTFEDGVDPMWTALDKNDYTNDALHYYSPQNVYTSFGNMIITTTPTDTNVVGYDDVQRKNTKITKHFKSAMIQSWNKFCFTGGIIEAEVVLPGKSNVGGLWPAFWILGNLARHTYVGSSEHIWPFAYSKCNPTTFKSQKINGCSNTQHYGLKAGVGRGAPEIDIFEVQPGNIQRNTGGFLRSPVGQPFASASYQVAPGRSSNRPGGGYWPGPDQWYDGLIGGNESAPNILFYGTYNHFLSDETSKNSKNSKKNSKQSSDTAADDAPTDKDYWSDAISYNHQLHSTHFEKRHVYRLEWEVPSSITNHNKTDGYLHWFLDNELVLSINGTALLESSMTDQGNESGIEISSEPMSIIFNTAVSSQWGFPSQCPNNCPCMNYDCNSKKWKDKCGFSEGFCDMMMTTPGNIQYKINWVRVYQDLNNTLHKVGCSTPERPTRRYIQAHEHLYKQQTDKQPLKSIQQGRGRCSNPKVVETGTITSRENCGGIFRGRCTLGNVCECYDGWTGPHCLAHDGYDPIAYDEPDTLKDLRFVPPSIAPSFLLFGLILLCVLLVVAVIHTTVAKRQVYEKL